MNLQQVQRMQASSCQANLTLQADHPHALQADPPHPSIEALNDMIELLKEYEQLSISKEDFSMAEEAKNKISHLKQQQLLLRKEQIAVQEKQNITHICKEGEDQIKKFQEFWDLQIQQLVQNLKQIEQSLCQQQQQQMVCFLNQLNEESVPKIKFSSKALEMKKYLTNLIKSRNYKEAENIKTQLRDLEIDETVKWANKFQERKKNRIEKVEKRQAGELQVLRVKLEGAFNEKIKERDSKFEILLKKNRKRRVESGKASRQRIRSKNGVLTESKCHLSNSRY